MIENARKNRTLQNKSENYDIIFINKELFKEIESVFGQKRRHCIVWHKYNDKGKSFSFVKEISKISDGKKASKAVRVDNRKSKKE